MVFYSFGYSLASKFMINDVRHLENAPDISGIKATSIEIQGNIHGNWHSCSPQRCVTLDEALKGNMAFKI